MTWTTDFCLRQKAEQTGVVFLVGFVVRFTISNLWINLSIPVSIFVHVLYLYLSTADLEAGIGLVNLAGSCEECGRLVKLKL